MQATTAGVRLDVGKAARFSALCSQLSFRPPAAHPVEPFILPKTREGAILAPQPCRIWGMSAEEPAPAKAGDTTLVQYRADLDRRLDRLLAVSPTTETGRQLARG